MENSTRPIDPRLSESAVSLLLEILEQPTPVLSGAALEFSGDAGKELLKAGLLKPDGHRATAWSGEDDDLPVEVTWSPEQGAYGYYHSSRGWVEVDASQLTQYRVDMQTVCAALTAGRSGGGQSATSWLTNLIWDLGDTRLPHRVRRMPVLFLRCVTDPRAWKEIRRSLLLRPPTSLRILLSAADARDHPGDVPSNNVLISIFDMFAGSGGIALNRDVLAARVDQRPAARIDETLVVVGDGREVRLYDKVFYFPKGEKQRRIVRVLKEHYDRGELLVSTASLVAELELPATARLRDYFKKSSAWEHLLFEKNGMCGFCIRP